VTTAQDSSPARTLLTACVAVVPPVVSRGQSRITDTNESSARFAAAASSYVVSSRPRKSSGCWSRTDSRPAGRTTG